MDPNLPFQPPAPVEPVQPIVPAMPPMESVPVAPTPIPPPPTKKTNWILILGIILLLVSVLALVGYYFIQTNKLRVNVSTPTPIALSSPSPIATTNPTANWKTYTNTLFSFKYPSDWTVDTKDASLNINSIVNVSKDNYNIAFWSNLEGIGGMQKEVPSTPIIISGLNLFKREIGNSTIDNTGSYEISSSTSSPTFQYKNKVFDIIITFPADQKSTADFQENSMIFDQILSTFQFTNAQSSPSAIPTTTPL